MQCEKKVIDLAVALCHELHIWLEPSGREEKTLARLMAFLREHTRLEIREHGNWFYAALRVGGTEPGIVAALGEETLIKCTVVHFTVGTADFGISPGDGILRLPKSSRASACL